MTMTREPRLPTGRRATSIATRLAVAIALILTIGGAGVTVAALAYARQAAEDNFDKLLASAALEIAGEISVAAGKVLVDLPVSAFDILALAPDDRVFYRVLGPGGETVTGYDALQPPASVGETVTFSDATFGDAEVRLASLRRVFVERAFSGEVVVLIAQTKRARTDLAWSIAGPTLIASFVAGCLLVGLVALAVNSALQPLRRIEQALLARDPKDLTPLNVRAPREVRAMVGAIDGFMARLAGRVVGMQRLIADATHQLRTPVAALRAQAELARDERDPERLREIVDRIHRRSMGLGRLTDQLLNQALIMHRSEAEPRELVDLRSVAVAVAEDADHDDPDAGESLRLDLPEEPVLVRGDAISLREATKNLVNNAFRYGRPPVTLEVRANPAAIAVTDRGEGVPEAAWADVGQRFARTSGSAPDSAGLGLAIVHAVAEAHGGRLRLSHDPARGFVAALALSEPPAPTERAP